MSYPTIGITHLKRFYLKEIYLFVFFTRMYKPQSSERDKTDLIAIVVFQGKTLVTGNVNSLLEYATEIKSTLQRTKVTEYDINE